MPNIRMCLAAVGLMVVMTSGAKAQGVAFAPTIGVVNNGANLNVTPVVTADRRYVRLGVSPQFNALNGFTNIAVPAAVGGGGNGGGLGGGGFGGLGGLGGGGGVGGGGGLGGAGGGGFRNQGIAANNRGMAAAPGLSAYRMGGSGAFASAYPAGMTGGMDPLADAVRQQMMMAQQQSQRAAAAQAASSRTTTARRRTR